MQEVWIKLDGKETRCKSVNYLLSRVTDEHRRPTTKLKIPEIKIERDPREDRGAVLNWLSIKNSSEGKKVEIIVYNDEEKSKPVEEIKLENAHIKEYKIEFKVENNIGLVESFTITAEKVNLNGVPFDEKWPKV